MYNLNNEEVMKVQKEFSKTSFGARAKVVSILPLILAITMGVIFGKYLSDDDVTNYLLSALGFIISMVGFCIAQLQYGNMLINYVNSKKEK